MISDVSFDRVRSSSPFHLTCVCPLHCSEAVRTLDPDDPREEDLDSWHATDLVADFANRSFPLDCFVHADLVVDSARRHC
jgi:hypothetical protein